MVSQIVKQKNGQKLINEETSEDPEEELTFYREATGQSVECSLLNLESSVR